MTTVGTVSNVISLAEASKKSATTKKDDALGADAFLELLLTQLKNQDPMEPLKENEMMALLRKRKELQSSISRSSL